MPDTGWKSPGTMASVDRDGEVEWDTPDEAKGQNDDYAQCNISKDTYSDWLRATNFSMGVPTDATIVGIEVQFDRYCQVLSDTGVHDSSLKLRKTSGQIGDDKASAVRWSATDDDVYDVYGASDDTWNAGLLYTDVNSADFGVDLSGFNEQALADRYAYVDHIQIKVHYTEEAPSGDIDEVNSIDWANVGEVMGVAKASIDEVMGVSSS